MADNGRAAVGKKKRKGNENLKRIKRVIKTTIKGN